MDNAKLVMRRAYHWYRNVRRMGREPDSDSVDWYPAYAAVRSLVDCRGDSVRFWDTARGFGLCR